MSESDQNVDTSLAAQRSRFDYLDGRATGEHLTEALRETMRGLAETRAAVHSVESWIWTVKGSLIIVPFVLAILGWWILDLNERLGHKVDTESRIEMLRHLEKRLDAIDRHIEASDKRIESLRDYYLERYGSSARRSPTPPQPSSGP